MVVLFLLATSPFVLRTRRDAVVIEPEQILLSSAATGRKTIPFASIARVEVVRGLPQPVWTLVLGGAHPRPPHIRVHLRTGHFLDFPFAHPQVDAIAAHIEEAVAAARPSS